MNQLTLSSSIVFITIAICMLWLCFVIGHYLQQFVLWLTAKKLPEPLTNAEYMARNYRQVLEWEQEQKELDRQAEERYGPGNEDYEYERHRQRTIDNKGVLN